MIFGLNSFAQKHVVVWKVINHVKVSQAIFRYNCGCLESWLSVWQESCVCYVFVFCWKSDCGSVTPRPSYSPLNHL